MENNFKIDYVSYMPNFDDSIVNVKYRLYDNEVHIGDYVLISTLHKVYFEHYHGFSKQRTFQ